MQYAQFNYIGEIALTEGDVNNCSHSGDCLNDIKKVLKKKYIQNQIPNIDPEKLKLELKEYGAWSEEELNNHNNNLERIIWIAAGNIRDEAN